jgi:predicted TIM-barrel fold metal-dependent hydrolase
MSLDFSGFKDIPIIDCHVHLWMLRKTDEVRHHGPQLDALTEVVDSSRLEGMYVFDGPDHAPLKLKAERPDLFYAGGPAPWTGDTSSYKIDDWGEYIKGLRSMGYNGIGEMGSKTVQREVHTPLDSGYYKGFWEACEDQDFPVLCHIGDVEDFWYEDKTPEWAKVRSWGYYDGDYPSLDELYIEIENVLGGHLGLKIALCHFLFMSPELERAAEFLDTHPNANLDLSLGVELMYNISCRRDDYREFFKRYDDRIIFGTDIGMSKTLSEHQARVWMIRRFLETPDEFHTPDEADDLLTRYELPYIGLDLPTASRRKIYGENFRRFWGEKPSDLPL